jgi:hypothetical protein
MLALKAAFIVYPGVGGFWLAVWFLGSLFWLTYSLTEGPFELMVYSISNVFKVRFSKLLCTWQCWDFPYKWRPPRIVLLRRWNKKILQIRPPGETWWYQFTLISFESETWIHGGICNVCYRCRRPPMPITYLMAIFFQGLRMQCLIRVYLVRWRIHLRHILEHDFSEHQCPHVHLVKLVFCEICAMNLEVPAFLYWSLITAMENE